MSKEMLIAIAAGAVSGIVYIAPLFGSLLGLILINFTQLPLFLAGLSMGVTTATVAATAGTVVVAVLSGIVGAIPFALAFAVPAVAIVRQALLWRRKDDGDIEWYPPGLVLTLLVSYGAAAFAIAAVLMAMQTEGLQAFTRTSLEANLSLVLPSVPAEQRAAATVLSSVFPALVVTSWILTVVVNGAIAQATLARAGRNLRPTPEFSRVQLPNGLALALLMSVVLWVAPGETVSFAGKTLTIIFAAPYFLQGLAVVHQLTRAWSGRVFALVVFYLVLFLLGWPGFALVSGLGFVEQWVGLRWRFAGPGPKDGES